MKSVRRGRKATKVQFKINLQWTPTAHAQLYLQVGRTLRGGQATTAYPGRVRTCKATGCPYCGVLAIQVYISHRHSSAQSTVDRNNIRFCAGTSAGASLVAGQDLVRIPSVMPRARCIVDADGLQAMQARCRTAHSSVCRPSTGATWRRRSTRSPSISMVAILGCQCRPALRDQPSSARSYCRSVVRAAEKHCLWYALRCALFPATDGCLPYAQAATKSVHSCLLCQPW